MVLVYSKQQLANTSLLGKALTIFMNRRGLSLDELQFVMESQGYYVNDKELQHLYTDGNVRKKTYKLISPATFYSVVSFINADQIISGSETYPLLDATCAQYVLINIINNTRSGIDRWCSTSQIMSRLSIPDIQKLKWYVKDFRETTDLDCHIWHVMLDLIGDDELLPFVRNPILRWIYESRSHIGEFINSWRLKNCEKQETILRKLIKDYPRTQVPRNLLNMTDIRWLNTLGGISIKEMTLYFRVAIQWQELG